MTKIPESNLARSQFTKTSAMIEVLWALFVLVCIIFNHFEKSEQWVENKRQSKSHWLGCCSSALAALCPWMFPVAGPIYKAGLNPAELFWPSRGFQGWSSISPIFISVLTHSKFYSCFFAASINCLHCLKEKLEWEVK